MRARANLRKVPIGLAALWTLAGLLLPSGAAAQSLQISAQRVRDGIAGGWTGAVIAGAWGFPTELVYNGRTVPKRAVPPYRIDQVNRYSFSGESDESYVEVPFLEAMQSNGVTASWQHWGPALASSRFKLFGANRAARRSLRHGVPAPASGDPDHNPFPNDIDFQIESDFVGMLAPAQPGAASEIAWRLGHVMNYGDGVYGGVMVSAMHAAAFQARSVDEIVAAGRDAIPAGTAYRRMIDDVIALHQRHPRHWKPTWRGLEQRWNAHSPEAKTHHVHSEYNVDAKLNGAYVLLGLLYGDGSFERTVRISMRAGQDSDCNPSNAASVLGTWLGRSRIPDRFKRGLAMHEKFPRTHYSLARAIAVNQGLARDLTAYRGGTSSGPRWTVVPSPGGPVAFEQAPLLADAGPEVSAAVIAAEGRTVSLSVSGSDPQGIADAWWSFGDLSAEHGGAVSHTYPRGGSYPVTVWVADGLGRTTATQLRVTVPD